MRDVFERPEIIREAEERGGGHNFIVESLIFLVVFLGITVAQVIVMVPVIIIGLSMSPDFKVMMEGILSREISDYGSVNQYMERIMESLPHNLFLIMLFATVLTIGGVLIHCLLIEKRSLRTIGFIKKNAVREYAVGLLVGVVLIGAITVLCLVLGVLEFNGLSENLAVGTLVLYFFGYVIQGMSEEMLCRGYLMVSVSRRSSLPVAVLVNSLLFALLHILNPGISVVALVNLTLFGIFASIYMIQRGSIWGVGAVHSAWNFVLGNIFGVAVSGNEVSASVFSVSVKESGLSGGAFGLEEGFTTTAVMIIAIVLVSILGKRKTEWNRTL